MKKNVYMLTHRGYFRQTVDVVKGSSVSSLLGNIIVSKKESEFGSFSNFYYRYEADVTRNLRVGDDSSLLGFVNTLPEKLQFTLEKPDDQKAVMIPR